MHKDTIFQVPDLGLDERIHVFRRLFSAPDEFGQLQVDAYVIVTDIFLIVCDTLLCPEDAQWMLNQVQDRLAGRELVVINSHADWDHVWGNSYFADSPHKLLLIGQALCAARMQATENQTLLKNYQAHFPLFKQVRIVPPLLTFEQSLPIDGGNLKLELLATPGHSADHCSLWLPELKLLLAFDAAEWPLPTIEGQHSVDAMRNSLEQLRALQPLQVLCSHGQTSHPDILDENLAYLHTIEERCRNLLATRQPEESELAHPSQLIAYPYEEIIGQTKQEIDHEFYRQTHEQNILRILEKLASEKPA
ncbi:hypothetical protein KDA_38990 [Dictyobacter alpinus]|uniref:Metallo-beta-lactamase domain-containing protein n=1 Tax=Dictyobacter alpinus TaxID=2014873 RepID=A0A402BAM8_9CHLR|nr:MBL fold metallo-hydrolase [Dictyobacter alpinus]GCE28415.1 hypothetical protein KDA_38990 [Dictyobacter alpinus]